MRAWLGLIRLCVAALLQVPAAGEATAQEFPFHLREGFIWVQGRVAESAAPMSFLLDSGAAVSVINLQTAERLGLKPGKRVSVQGVGANTEGFWPEHLSASAGEAPLPRDYLAVDLSELSGSCDCRVDGLIGADFFRGRIVQIDFAAGKIRTLAAVPTGASQEVLPLQVRHGALRVPVRVNGCRARWVRLDTGCASSLQWVADRAESESYARRVAVALTKVSVGVARSTVQLGATCFEGIATDLHQQAIFPGEAGLLGNGLLSRFESVTVDAKAGRLVLQRMQGGD
jgi:predicted aspartyl protease